MSNAHRMESHTLHVEVRQRLTRGGAQLRLSAWNMAYASMGMLPVGKTHQVGVKH